MQKKINHVSLYLILSLTTFWELWNKENISFEMFASSTVEG